MENIKKLIYIIVAEIIFFIIIIFVIENNVHFDVIITCITTIVVMIDTLYFSFLQYESQRAREYRFEVLNRMPYITFENCVFEMSKRKNIFPCLKMYVKNSGNGICRNIKIIYVDYRKTHNTTNNILQSDKMNVFINGIVISNKTIAKEGNSFISFYLYEKICKRITYFYKFTIEFEDVYGKKYLETIEVHFDEKGCFYHDSSFPVDSKKDIAPFMNDIDLLLSEWNQIPMGENI